MRNKKILRIVLLLVLIAVVAYVGRRMQSQESAPRPAVETASDITTFFVLTLSIICAAPPI